MMSNFSPLTLAFLEQKPLSASRELASLKATDAAQFLDEIPARFAAPVLAAMPPWSAAVILTKMNAVSAAASLGQIDYRDASAILRNIAIKDRSRILLALPEKLRTDFETSLKYPDDTVGAHMTTAIMTLTQEHMVSDAMELFRQSKKTKSNIIHIIGADYKLIGAVSARDLLQNPPDTLLSKIMDLGVARISARSTLLSVHDLSGWVDYSELPVINRQDQTIGVLLRKTAKDALQVQPVENTRFNQSIAASILDAFLVSINGLAKIVTETQKVSAEEKRP
ncbi:magnesium transporter MgtE N-terminal domain-containing protein [Sneathiella sp.]|jgi:magnesium transporter|uniref:magnesium transporter MgtE N-terminal domain-containing protein n=1 Tax=Sneathiella sp. TaxID=1964365 RepID=UPI0039E570F6